MRTKRDVAPGFTERLERIREVHGPKREFTSPSAMGEHVGVSRVTWGRWESGETVPDRRTLVSVCEAASPGNGEALAEWVETGEGEPPAGPSGGPGEVIEKRPRVTDIREVARASRRTLEASTVKGHPDVATAISLLRSIAPVVLCCATYSLSLENPYFLLHRQDAA